MIELRGPCGHLYAQLDIEEGVIVKKCPQCSKAAGPGARVYHCFDVETGKLLNGDITLPPTPGAAGDLTVRAPDDYPAGCSIVTDQSPSSP